MKKTLYALGLAGTLGLAACQSQPIDPKASNTVYQGVLPCADCAGIKTTLSYCQIWCMTIRQRSCQIDLPPLFHPETVRCPRPASVGRTP